MKCADPEAREALGEPHYVERGRFVEWVVVVVAALACSYCTTGVVGAWAKRRALLDRPNERSAHLVPTPRLGGLGIMGTFLAVAAAVVWAREGEWAYVVVLTCTGGIAVLGLIDDLRSLSARHRFAWQCLGAAVVVGLEWQNVQRAWWTLHGWAPGWLLGAASIVWIVWMTNLFNFMDGVDGLAGGQALLAGGGLAVAAALAGDQLACALALLLSATALGFLAHNFPPASIFMGDVGSTAIGFLLGAFPFLGVRGISVEVVALASAMFVLDATTTLLRRAWRGERLLEAHRTHLYQRPLALGVTHRQITVTAYGPMSVVACAAAVWDRLGYWGKAGVVSGTMLLFVGMAACVGRLERRAKAVTSRAEAGRSQ